MEEKNVKAKGAAEQAAPAAKQDRVFILKYNRPNIFTFAMVPPQADIVIMPKNNFIKESDWELIKGNPLVPTLFEGTQENDFVPAMEWVSGCGPDDNLPSGNSSVNFLQNLKGNEVLKTINDTLDVKILSDWLDNEKRPEVVKALQAQIQKMRENPYKK